MAGEWRETIYGSFAADFVEERLADLCDPDAGIQTGPFGSQLHQEDYVPVGTPIITVEHLGENHIIHKEVPCVSDADRNRLSRYLLREGDIVFSRVGSVDRRALVRRAEDGWMFSGRCLRIRPNREKIDAGYLSYFFGLPAFKEHIRAIAVGATMPSLNTAILSDVVVPHAPSISEQRAMQVVLEQRLRDALARLNPDPPAEALEDAFRKLAQPQGADLLQRNRALHRLLVDGVTVEYRDAEGNIRGAQARVIDFDEPENNNWLAVNQFAVVENRHSRRPDIVLFLNGLPLSS